MTSKKPILFKPGDVKNSWTLISRNEGSKRAIFACVCGWQGELAIANISSGKSKRCVRCRVTSGRTKAFKSVIRTAERRGIRWDLTEAQWTQLSSANCYYCDRPPSNYYRAGDYSYNGIDRIDSNLPYVIDNCVTSCRFCNRSKSDMTQTEFYQWIKRVYEKHLISE